MRKVQYLSNKNLLTEISKSKAQDKPTRTLVDMMMKMVDRYSTKGNFRGYSYLDDMKSEALVHLVNAWHKFDETKSNNPFAYYSTIITNAFVRVLNAEKKSQDIRDDLLEIAGKDPSYSRQMKVADVQASH